MLAGVPLTEVIRQMGKGKASWSKILECLDYFGIAHDTKAVYPEGKGYTLPACCIVYNNDGFVLWYKGRYYGVDSIDPIQTVSWIEVAVH